MTHGVRAFLPGSLVDMRPIKDTSRRTKAGNSRVQGHPGDKSATTWWSAAAPCSSHCRWALSAKLLSTLPKAPPSTYRQNITDYGAFVDLGGIDGLLHITDLAWRRVKHRRKSLTVGQEVTGEVLKVRPDRIASPLGLKQLGDDPWSVWLAATTGHPPVRQGHQHHRLRCIR